MFETLYFLKVKLYPIFDELKMQWFPLSILIFGQKSCFLGPIIFKIPQTH